MVQLLLCLRITSISYTFSMITKKKRIYTNHEQLIEKMATNSRFIDPVINHALQRTMTRGKVLSMVRIIVFILILLS